MPARARALLLVLSAGAAVSVAGCGGSKSEEDKVKDVVNGIEKDPPSLCTKYATDALIQQLGGPAGCKRAAGNDSGKAKIKNLVVSGNQATVTATDATGTATLALVKQNGEWKVNRIS